MDMESSNMWNDFSRNSANVQWIAPVEYFKNAPFATIWNDMAREGLILEFPNPFAVGSTPPKWVWWFGKVLGFAGYRANLQFERIDEESEICYTTWISFFSDIPKYIGYCRENGIPMSPISPDSIEVRQDVVNSMYAKLETSDTLPRDHYSTVFAEILSKTSRFKENNIVEAMDRNDCSQFRVAQIHTIIGDRVHILYCDAGIADRGFWFSQHSTDLNELGWCNTIGVDIRGWGGGQGFPRVNPSVFPETPKQIKISEGMVFEMRHPHYVHKLVAGYVARILRHGYFVAATDWSRPEELVEKVVHVTSDYIFPINFCRDHKARLIPPKSEKGKFSWENYLKTSKTKHSPLDLSSVQRPKNRFKRGNKLEAIQLVQPEYIRPATVTHVAGHLLKIHFDGMSRARDDAYQWVSCLSTDIYPVGYAEMVCYPSKGEPDNVKFSDTI